VSAEEPDAQRAIDIDARDEALEPRIGAADGTADPSRRVIVFRAAHPRRL